MAKQSKMGQNKTFRKLSLSLYCDVHLILVMKPALKCDTIPKDMF